MIGKIVIGKSFKGCIGYCLNDKLKQSNGEMIVVNRAEVLLYNKCYGNEKELVQQFNEVRQLNTKLAKPVMHITLSLGPEDKLSKDKLMEMSEHCAKELGFENSQYIAIVHRDTNHQHLHIVANRIGFDKLTVSDSNNYQKMANYCRKMEEKYNLQQVLNPKKFLPRAQQNVERIDKRKEQLRQCIKEALRSCSNYVQFEQKMKAAGYVINKGRGISFTDEKKVTFKGSEVNHSLQTIEKILAQQRIIQSSRQATGSSSVTNNEGSKAAQSVGQEGNKEGLPKLVEDLMKPEENHDQNNQSLFAKKRKKKKQSHHL